MDSFVYLLVVPIMLCFGIGLLIVHISLSIRMYLLWMCMLPVVNLVVFSVNSVLLSPVVMHRHTFVQ